MPEVKPIALDIVAKLLKSLSLVLSPTMDSANRNFLVQTALKNIERNLSTQISLSGFIHCIDLIINAQSPFDKEIRRFDVRAINNFVNIYKQESVRRMNLIEQKPVGARQRQYLLAKALAKNPAAEKSLMELADKLEAKYSVQSLPVGKKTGSYVNIADYLLRNNLNKSILGDLLDFWQKKGMNPQEESFRLLYELNCGNQETILHQFINQVA